MKITCVETIYLQSGIRVHAGPEQYLWVRLHTDEGLVGLGETYPFPGAAKAVIHSALAGVLLGRDPMRIDKLWADMLLAVSYSGWAGAEMRAISAVDLALWDLKGKALNTPVYQLLGGPARESIRTYNTCYDRVDFLTHPVRLAQELDDSGIRAMKIWPFDGIARQNAGQFITPAQSHYARSARPSEIAWKWLWSFMATGTCHRPSGLRRHWNRCRRCGSKRCCRRTTWRPTVN